MNQEQSQNQPSPNILSRQEKIERAAGSQESPAESEQCPDCKGTKKVECCLCAGHGTVNPSLGSLRRRVIDMQAAMDAVFGDLFVMAGRRIYYSAAEREILAKARKVLDMRAALVRYHAEQDKGKDYHSGA